MPMASVGTRDSFTGWLDPEGRKQIILYRRSLRNSMRRYVEKIPYIDGVSENAADKYPFLRILAGAYVNLVRGELAQHNNDPSDALWTGLVFGPLFSEIWQTACSLPLTGLKIPTSIPVFQGADPAQQEQRVRWLLEFSEQLPSYELEDWIAIETFETAEILARAYEKAFIELATVCAQSEAMTIRHHASLLAEIVTDMLNLVMQHGEQTDSRLPETHLHKQLGARQEALRAPYATKSAV